MNLPFGKACVCDICGEPLQFLLQILHILNLILKNFLIEILAASSCLFCDE